MQKPVICCIGYNRPKSMKRLLDSVGKAVYDDNDVLLVISIDESPESDAVEEVAKKFEWKYGEKIIKRYPMRMGLKDHCLLCGDLSIEYGSVILLEDDVVVAPGYYRYVKKAVEFYKDDNKVLGISLYSQKWVSDMNREFLPSSKGFDTFYHQRDVSHGQCWIGSRWKKFKDWYLKHKDCLPSYDKRIPPCVYSWNEKNSWSKYMSFFLVEYDLYYVCPYYSFATNLSESGVHAKITTDICQVPITEGIENNFNFGSYDETVVYDALFERKDMFIGKICGIDRSNICFDINGMKYDWSGFEYILTSKKLSYDCVISFGANMEPIESNIIYNNLGNAIHLYKIPTNYIPVSDSKFLVRTNANMEIMWHILNRYPAKTLIGIIIRKIRRKIIKK